MKQAPGKPGCLFAKSKYLLNQLNSPGIGIT
jgi:hypothetical protein